MGERISPADLAVIDRRQLLCGAAAATAISGLPASEPAVAAPQEIEAANLASWAHFSTATCSRLEEIAFRNRVRKEAGLPLLSVAKELRRMKMVADEERFRRFAALYRPQSIGTPVRNPRNPQKVIIIDLTIAAAGRRVDPGRRRLQ
jgi:hypothetical protein